MPSTPTASTWTCATCGAVTTDRGRELLGSRCWMCGGRLIRDLEPAEPAAVPK